VVAAMTGMKAGTPAPAGFVPLAMKPPGSDIRIEVTRGSTHELRFKRALIDKLTHEMAVIKRLKFAAKAERFNTEQRSLLEDDTDADLQELAEQIEALQPKDEEREPPAKKPADARVAKRQALPPELPRREIRHEPESTACGCGCALKRIGEDVSEKLDYTPGEFSVERHIRGKWVCGHCETLTQAPVPAHVIDKGLPTTGLLAQVVVAKYLDHLPLYRQESVFARAGHKSVIAAQALKAFRALYKVEEELIGITDAEARRRWRHEHARPLAEAFHRWLISERLKVPNGSATAKAIDYSLKRWAASSPTRI
jgi:transposase